MRGREFFLNELPRIGCRVWPSQANFVMFEPPKPARQVFESLLERGIIVRPLASFGLGTMIRVNVGTDAENRAFIAALAEILGG
jgi:histidinol-phosphate aminotransferase